MLKMAVRHHADAVYLGLPNFSARAKSTEFTKDNLAEYTAFCHKYGTKVYLTLNTLVKQSELRDALSVAETAVTASVDGVLVQDLGLAKILRSLYPELNLHASTQMGVHNAEGALYAKSLGFTRVVVSRETPLEDIKAIKCQTGLEVEVFIHGALCVSFSGNCYYSSLVSGCSGNRGKCLQLCRKKYLAETRDLKRIGSFLSPADLCLIDRMRELTEAGVDSFKIEGRLKRPEYVGVTVDAYKKALRGETITAADREGLASVFCRGGFCEGYLDGGTAAKNFIGKALVGHGGVMIGTIERVNRGWFTAKTEAVLDVDDGFKVIRNGEEIGGATSPKAIGKGLYRFSSLAPVKAFDQVFRTTDAAQLRNQYGASEKIPLDVSGEFTVGKQPALSAWVQGRKVTCKGLEPLNSALNAPLSEEDLVSSLKKMGGTDYYIRNLEIKTDGVFMMKSALNALRRALVGKIDSIFSTHTDKEAVRKKAVFKNGYETDSEANIYYIYHDTEDLNKIKNLDNSQVFVVYEPQSYQNLIRGNRKTFLSLPVYASGQDLEVLYRQKDVVKSYAGLVANNVYGVQLAIRWQMPVIAGFGLNLCNYEAEGRFFDVFFSVENLAENNAVAFGFGEFPLMTLAHCPYRVVTGKGCDACTYEAMTYTDECGKQLFVRRERMAQCRFTLTDRLELPTEERDRRMAIDLRGSSVQEVLRFLNGSKALSQNSYFGRVLK